MICDIFPEQWNPYLICWWLTHFYILRQIYTRSYIVFPISHNITLMNVTFNPFNTFWMCLVSTTMTNYLVHLHTWHTNCVSAKTWEFERAGIPGTKHRQTISILMFFPNIILHKSHVMRFLKINIVISSTLS
jgi:hypothetical protein